jgi:hypothetical protein
MSKSHTIPHGLNTDLVEIATILATQGHDIDELRHDLIAHVEQTNDDQQYLDDRLDEMEGWLDRVTTMVWNIQTNIEALFKLSELAAVSIGGVSQRISAIERSQVVEAFPDTNSSEQPKHAGDGTLSAWRSRELRDALRHSAETDCE